MIPIASWWTFIGWAVTNETPDNLIGYAGLFSSYAGGGDASSNYVIGQNGARIVKSSGMASFQSLRITNNNYAASSMLNGDSFAKKFGGASGDDQDWFLLEIIGYDAGDMPIDTVRVYLAGYRFTDNSQDYIIKDWTTVDLTPIEYAKYIEFELSSSDNSGGYMNTPAFYAVDKITHSSAISVSENNLATVTVYPYPANEILNLKMESMDGLVQILNLQGQIVMSEIVNGNQTSLNISHLSNGFYHIVIQSEKGAVTKKFQKI